MVGTRVNPHYPDHVRSDIWNKGYGIKLVKTATNGLLFRPITTTAFVTMITNFDELFVFFFDLPDQVNSLSLAF